ncbi:unnamed protein product [Chironomus riparius]|uniref:Uncharacterized protein n=1 Tax=Chironomus riparius TaxID=315576 RepID=A0A9N9WZ35_9DIPT|nr:unnamed protein product [Chironomus riparius]
MFELKWLRRIVRKKTNPIPVDIAHKYKGRLSFVYAFIAWNAFGLVIFQIFRGKADWADHHGLPKEDGTSAQQFARMLNIQKAKVVRISGLQTEQYDIDHTTNETEYDNNN